ncbi:MAG: Anaphase-promoting complex subunit 1 [Bathelium mastoideum]|nr:MAG: Anaphase-promoting complex subunit 1 [Bathelium mastoideum]
MANVISLGLHTPSALPFLIAEGILPEDPLPHQYHWSLYEDDEQYVDELVTTEYCAVWSRGSVVQKVFQFEIEKQKINHAVLTWFKSEENFLQARETNSDPQGSVAQSTGQNSSSKVKNAPRKSFTSSHAARRLDGLNSTRSSHSAQDGQSRAFVVVLESQAHVFFPSGTTHIVNLPFKVEKVLPAPWGLLLQRKLSSKNGAKGASTLPLVPPNSFISSQPFLSQTSPPPSQSQRSKTPIFQFGASNTGLEPSLKDGLPRLFALKHPLSEIGLVVSEGSMSSSVYSRTIRKGIKSPYEALDPAEEIIFISLSNELSDVSDPKLLPLIIVVTLNRDSGVYTVWYALYSDPKPLSAFESPSALPLLESTSRRRSSFNPGAGTGTTTPAIRARDNVRESFGGDHRLGEPAIPSSQRGPHPRESLSQSQSVQNAEDVFASQVDPDLQGSRNPTRESRRISSFISRADLSTGPERSNFADAARGHSHSGANPGSLGRRGQSLGGQNERKSFGGLGSIRSRPSTPGSTSRLSLFSDDLPPIDLPKLPSHDILTTDFGSLEFQEPLDSLPKEVALVKVHTIAVNVEGPQFSQSYNAHQHHKPDVSVLTVQVPKSPSANAKEDHGVNVCILNRSTHELVVVGLNLKLATFRSVLAVKTTRQPSEEQRFVMVPQVEGFRRFNGFSDMAKVRSLSTTDILTLSQGQQDPDIRLHSRSSFDHPLRLPIDNLKMFNPFNLAPPHSPSSREAGKRRIIKPERIQSLQHAHFGGLVDLVDSNRSHHKTRIVLQPSSNIWNKVLEVCQHVLPVDEGECVRLFWCAAHRWLIEHETHVVDVESIATCITIFSMFFGILEPQGKALHSSQSRGPRTPSGRKRKTPDPSGKSDSPWSMMMAAEFQYSSVGNWNDAAWGWAIKCAESTPVSLRSPAKSTRAATSTSAQENLFIVDAVDLTHRFLTENTWAKTAATRLGWIGQFNHDQSSARKAINGIVVQSLHLLREESKLDVLMKANNGHELQLLASMIAQMGHWLGWQFWDWRISNYYELEGARSSRWKFDNIQVTDIANAPPSKPPSILQWIEDTIAGRAVDAFPTVDQLRDPVRPSSRGLASSNTQAVTKLLTPRSYAIIGYLTQSNLVNVPDTIHVERMAKHEIDAKMLETLPAGVAAPLREHIVACQASPPTTWSEELLRLVDRDDLHSLATAKTDWLVEPISVSDDAAHAVSNMHSICRFNNRAEYYSSPRKETHAISRLIFNEDKRHIEAASILEPLKTPVAECQRNPQWSEAEHLEAQKEVMQWVMVRTVAISPGSALLHFDGTHPMLTEKFNLPGFSSVCTMKPLNNTVSADRSSLTEEKLCWAFFHAGVSRGLSIAIEAQGIDTSWIVFNKPNELTNRHAGLLLALGLNGHLKHMAKWLAFKYLTPKHTMTSIGLLLGLSASFLGTMDQLVTRLLSVHVTRMLPEGAAELNVSPMTQTAGLMGIGLLYYDTQHRRMSEVMLSEIRHIEIEDPSSGSPNVLRDESYRLAAGFALGLINLAQGNNLGGLHNMGLVERLLEVAVGTKPVDAVHIVDQATAGATIAIGLIFMRSGNVALANKIDIPDTLPQFDYVRPDLFLLRTLAKHLILWDKIKADQRWIKQNVLPEYGSMIDLSGIKALRSEQMPLFNTLAGLLWSVSLKYAGSGDMQVRDFLIRYLDQFIRLCKLPTLRYDARLTRNTVRNCQDLVALAAATVMAGRGDLVVFRRLRLLHGRVHADVPYGSHLAAHVALGALFLGSGRYTFGTSKLAVAALICAFYPLFPTSVLDNKAHLQAFRHFWVLAAEARCLIIREVDTHRAISLPITVLQHTGAVLHLQAPILLPELHTIAQVKTNSPDYWQVTLDFAANPEHIARFRKNQTIFVRHRPASEVHGSTFHAALLALNDAQSNQTAKQMWDWIFNLPIFSASRLSPTAFDQAEWTSVLPVDEHSSTNLDMKGTVVDTRLALSRSAEGWDHDDLMQLRILFTWAEKVSIEGTGRLRWLARGVVDGLKARVAQRVKELESEL